MPTLTHSLDIAAPIDVVWEVLTDFEAYGHWNRFTPRVETSGKVGEPVILHVRLHADPTHPRLRAQRLVMERNERYTLAWGMAGLVLDAHRIQTLSQLDERRTRYTSEEPFRGVLGTLVPLFMQRTLMRGYRWAAEGLKQQAEEQYQAQGRDAS